MAIILGSDPWSPSLFQSGVPIDSNDPGIPEDARVEEEREREAGELATRRRPARARS